MYKFFLPTLLSTKHDAHLKTKMMYAMRAYCGTNGSNDIDIQGNSNAIVDVSPKAVMKVKQQPDASVEADMLRLLMIDEEEMKGCKDEMMKGRKELERFGVVLPEKSKEHQLLQQKKRKCMEMIRDYNNMDQFGITFPNGGEVPRLVEDKQRKSQNRKFFAAKEQFPDPKRMNKFCGTLTNATFKNDNGVTSNNVPKKNVTSKGFVANGAATNNLTSNIAKSNNVTAKTVATNANGVAKKSVTSDNVTFKRYVANGAAFNNVPSNSVAYNNIAAHDLVSNSVAKKGVAFNNTTPKSLVANGAASNNITSYTVKSNNVASNNVTANSAATNGGASNGLAKRPVASNNVTCKSFTANGAASNNNSITFNSEEFYNVTSNSVASNPSAPNSAASNNKAANKTVLTTTPFPDTNTVELLQEKLMAFKKQRDEKGEPSDASSIDTHYKTAAAVKEQIKDSKMLNVGPTVKERHDAGISSKNQLLEANAHDSLHAKLMKVGQIVTFKTGNDLNVEKAKEAASKNKSPEADVPSIEAIKRKMYEEDAKKDSLAFNTKKNHDPNKVMNSETEYFGLKLPEYAIKKFKMKTSAEPNKPIKKTNGVTMKTIFRNEPVNQVNATNKEPEGIMVQMNAPTLRLNAKTIAAITESIMNDKKRPDVEANAKNVAAKMMMKIKKNKLSNAAAEEAPSTDAKSDDYKRAYAIGNTAKLLPLKAAFPRKSGESKETAKVYDVPKNAKEFNLMKSSTELMKKPATTNFAVLTKTAPDFPKQTAPLPELIVKSSAVSKELRRSPSIEVIKGAPNSSKKLMNSTAATEKGTSTKSLLQKIRETFGEATKPISANLRRKAAKFKARAVLLENKAARLESKVASLETKAADLESKVAKLETKVVTSETAAAKPQRKMSIKQTKSKTDLVNDEMNATPKLATKIDVNAIINKNPNAETRAVISETWPSKLQMGAAIKKSKSETNLAPNKTQQRNLVKKLLKHKQRIMQQAETRKEIKVDLKTTSEKAKKKLKKLEATASKSVDKIRTIIPVETAKPPAADAEKTDGFGEECKQIKRIYKHFRLRNQLKPAIVNDIARKFSLDKEGDLAELRKHASMLQKESLRNMQCRKLLAQVDKHAKTQKKYYFSGKPLSEDERSKLIRCSNYMSVEQRLLASLDQPQPAVEEADEFKLYNELTLMKDELTLLKERALKLNQSAKQKQEEEDEKEQEKNAMKVEFKPEESAEEMQRLWRKHSLMKELNKGRELK